MHGSQPQQGGKICIVLAFCLCYEKRLPFRTASSYQRLGQQFATFFGTYTKAINKANNRTGSLFEKNFKRKPITNDAYLRTLITYIHYNPQKHGFVDDYRDWPYSSYPVLCSVHKSILVREEVLTSFDGIDGFHRFHQNMADYRGIESLVDDGFE